ncbi:MAG TPA: hypothetical protein P5105_04300 [Victivallales bacterium]|mgnify:CR=1 FL=1|nr:hypothetical protein [Victivallales bacterium]HPO90360.1 hypothetical protein [Victivallales bacterium]HRR06484.1 hypothetical protein [Victivallales bacterium]HRU00435.1 hypothetical protein [Victivallales bacterium]
MKNNTLKLSEKEKNIIRLLASEIAEIASKDHQSEFARLWTLHNDLKITRPMVLVFPEGSWRELLPESELESESVFARNIERELRKIIYYDRFLRDENPIENNFDVPITVKNSGYGLYPVVTKSSQSDGAEHFEQVIRGIEDIEKMHLPEVQVDWEDSYKKLEFFQNLFGDILNVRLVGHYEWWCSPIDEYAKLRGLDQLYYDIIDAPELVHEYCKRYVEARIHTIKELERQNALTLRIRNEYVGSGGNSYTNDLPYIGYDGKHVRTIDLWGFATAQMFSEVSPEMHEEFAIQHEKKFLSLFGLNCYGCCEPLHNKLEIIIKHIPRLRRISISPWANIEKSAEILQNNYVFSWKPNPTILAGESFNPEFVKEQIKSFCERTKGCITEIIMKDTHTVRNEPQRIHEWVKITRQVCSDFT